MVYLVKFVSEAKYKPNALTCSNFNLKLGTFHHYRSIEDEKFRDIQEGQIGREIVVQRPCQKLEELASNPRSGIDLNPENLDEEGNFVARTALLVHEHLAEFNAWVFCCSLVENLDEIPEIQQRFEAKDYFFITNPERFSSQLLRSLGADLQQNFFLPDGRPRIDKFKFENALLLDGFHSNVAYDSETQWMSTAYVDTLTEFLSEQVRELDRSIWFRKQQKFCVEKEFRWVFYPSRGRATGHESYYSVNDDYRILRTDVCGSTSSTPQEAVWEPKRPRLEPLISQVAKLKADIER
ncbi:hypothetical protein PVW51_21670 [Sulfitobacter sp. PR48]|uniref:hypothetical protein n=1 Tax=Sulfitobacter sp. PR48 TaxID=3028383 RepID=UPI00237B5D81|nr:hypothetical protein [Sulfitobacter sp. PR48]MDD9723320.1 hypothetical protein [Sulfitobacter sp. PR48]